MRRWLILLWLLIPVALLSYHYGPGQDAIALAESREHYQRAIRYRAQGHYEEAIQSYGDSLSKLPADQRQTSALQHQLRLGQLQTQFEQGRLAECLSGLALLLSDVDRDLGNESKLAFEVRESLGRAHYQAMLALRLEAAEEDVWMRHWELSRQNYRFLAEHTPSSRNLTDRKNLEVVIKSFDQPVPPVAAAGGGASVSTAGLEAVQPTQNAAPGAGPPIVSDARPRQAPEDVPEPNVSEFDLGS